MNIPLELLEKAARENRLAHFLLFHGESMQQQKAVALRLAQILNCGQDAAERPCQVCQACQKINSGNHPDVLWLKPPKASLGIEQILTWQPKIYLKHYEGVYRVSIIEQGETLTLAAANALLKVIEEPPPRNLFVLCVHNVEGILPTIRSRAQLVYFPDLSEEAWLGQWGEAERHEARQAFRLSGKNPNLAAMILQRGTAAAEEWVEKFLTAVQERDFLQLNGLFPVDREQTLLYLQIMAVKIQAEMQKREISPAGLLAIGKATDILRQQVNPRLVLENLALELFGIDFGGG